MVREIVLGEELSDLGIVVSPEELFDMVQGEKIFHTYDPADANVCKS